MVIVMKPGATEEQIQHVIQRVEQMGLETRLLRGTNRNVIAAIGDKRGVNKDFLEAAPGVENVVPILAPYKIASTEAHPERTIVRARDAVFGTDKISVIAGPCTVEGREMTIEVAKRVRDAGAVALRGGAFKPRTSPYTFQGLREEGLEYLAEARERTGLAIVTEVVSPDTVELVSSYADIIQIGTRNAQNFALLSAVGKQPKPVLLKRGMSSTISEFLLATEYVLSQGNSNVILCERGIRTFEDHSRFTLSLSAVPELHRCSHLPVIVDPSHGTGHRHLIEPMCRAAVAAGTDGLIVEVHPSPEQAMLDGAQAMTPDELATMMVTLRRIAEAIGRSM